MATAATATRIVNPNAPQIEFFTTDTTSIAPGEDVTLYWSTRNVDQAVIYRLNENGQRTQTYNIPAAGKQTVDVGKNERGRVDFMLIVGEGAQQSTQTLNITILCPTPWFFQPAPAECPSEESQPTTIVEQPFERGRMIYLAQTNRVYVLFNDSESPAWVDFANQYNPAIHPERDEAFEAAIAGTGLVQPIGKLGFVWRGDDSVRRRLGIGVTLEVSFEGFTQRAPTTGATGNADSLYITSSNGTVLQLLPGGRSWQILTPAP